MIDKLSKTLLNEYDYKLESYKVLHQEIKKNKTILPAIILFLVVVVLFFTVDDVDFIVLGFAFFLLVIIPLALKKEESYDIVVITPECLIKQVSKDKVSAIKFDEVLKFGTDKTGVVIKDDKNSISLDPSVLKEDILTVIEILEAKGKTFDKSKEYMIRPIEITIVDNEVKITDIKLEESQTEKLVSKVIKEYAMITPGFIEDINLLNSVIEGAYVEEDSLYIRISRFEVKEGHPENTLFESQVANDCIIIFENAHIASIVKKDAEGTSKKIIEAPLENLVSGIEKAVISDWKCSKNSIDFQLSIELYIISVSLEYKEVIVGWNEFI